MGLIGRGIGASRSPELHAHALRLSNKTGEYSLFDCADVAQAQAVLDRLRAGRIDGLNVTTPYKAWAAASCQAFLDREGTLQRGPAPLPVNTLFLREDLFCGASTDGPGLCDALRWAGVSLAGKSAVLLGCGGAGQSIAGDLLAGGLARLVLCNRDPQPAQALARHLDDSRVVVEDWGQPAPLVAADLVLHATRLGHGAAGLQPDVAAALAWLPWPAWRAHAARLVDLGYAQNLTPVQELAQREGVRLLAGSGQAMLAAQAARSFALWTGACVDGRELLRTILPGTI